MELESGGEHFGQDDQIGIGPLDQTLHGPKVGGGILPTHIVLTNRNFHRSFRLYYQFFLTQR